eukprot:TRINITY_DN6850_c0_g1_i1.p1 TRINITY_DN6850_c0_g1~~TRINITY_DN6850_c0_g1_i1.p1  ORF type:complete len:198 (+),score=58.16 TRINITY_DN6850_c0_g1_i1:65-595(+)
MMSTSTSGSRSAMFTTAGGSSSGGAALTGSYIAEIGSLESDGSLSEFEPESSDRAAGKRVYVRCQIDADGDQLVCTAADSGLVLWRADAAAEAADDGAAVAAECWQSRLLPRLPQFDALRERATGSLRMSGADGFKLTLSAGGRAEHTITFAQKLHAELPYPSDPSYVSSRTAETA